jgi:hypothetical protein
LRKTVLVLNISWLLQEILAAEIYLEEGKLLLDESILNIEMSLMYGTGTLVYRKAFLIYKWNSKNVEFSGPVMIFYYIFVTLRK